MKRNSLISSGSVAGLALFTAVNMFPQTATPYLSVGAQTVNTNGATFLRDNTHVPQVPGGYPLVNSPGTTVNFQGLTDNNTLFPPDTCGAVGTNWVVTMLNTQVRISTRSGATITTLSLSNFWTGTNIGSFTEVFDPRIVYDPYNDRWIASASVEPFSSNSGLLIGVSRTSSPTNTGDAGWNLRRVKADSLSTRFADFPMLGFNKDWIVVSANMFLNSTVAFDRENVYVFNKTNLYAGSFTSPAVLTDTNSQSSFSAFPAVTYDSALSTLYLVQDYNGNYQSNGYVRLRSITGPVNSPVLNNTTNPILIRVKFDVER